MIINATYAGSNNTRVYIEPDNKTVSVRNPELLEWVAAGNTINLYTEQMGDNKEVKTSEIYNYADSLIQVQEATFFDRGKSVGRNRDRLLKQQNKRNNKLIKGQGLNPAEELEDDRYDSFLDWTDTIYDTADIGEDIVEDMDDVAAVKAFDPVTMLNWPIWT